LQGSDQVSTVRGYNGDPNRFTQLRISIHTTYVALNPCICQLATGVLKTRSGSRQPRAQIHHRPASCHGGYTLLSPSLHSHCVLSYSGISLPEAKLTVGVSRPGGPSGRRVSVAACPSPDGSSAWASVKGGRSEAAGDRCERGGNPAAFVFVPRPGRVRLQ
jgi:hypothetical protein